MIAIIFGAILSVAVIYAYNRYFLFPFFTDEANDDESKL